MQIIFALITGPMVIPSHKSPWNTWCESEILLKTPFYKKINF